MDKIIKEQGKGGRAVGSVMDRVRCCRGKGLSRYSISI
jgi:hypothetical protein